MGQLLVPALITVTFQSLLVAGLYLYLYSTNKDRLLQLWGAAWGIYSLRFIVHTAIVLGVFPSWTVVIQEAATLFGALLCLSGANALAGRSTPRWARYGSVACLGWVAMTPILRLPFFWSDLPVSLFTGLLFAWSGVTLLRQRQIRGAGRAVAGYSLILWGIHRADYVFLRPVEWFAPWGFLIASLLFIAAAVGILLLYYSRIRMELESDIAKRKRVEEKLQRTLESLKKAVGTTIQVMVSVAETRDPYTAGHQFRSADLARAIAVEMGLPQDHIDGVWMAGSIHDIGKLSIPAEILSKPTKLSEIEFSLIKEHARRGFEILKDVESSWPLAEIVYQHHERMDGSGYPRNLKGDEILIEARILAVADVVEAMASHRPYRAGLGIEAALNVIENGGGAIYDQAVADACLRLFREKGFQLAEA